MRALPGRDSRTSLHDSPARVTREGVKADQRQRILRATGELVAKRGYNAVTVELIVKRARVSYKTFYAHFANKEECFLELFDAVMAQTRAQIDDAVAAESGAPWPQQVIAGLRALFDAFIADPLIARASIVEAPTVGPLIIERYEKAMTVLSPLLRQGRAIDGPQPDELPETLEDTLAGGVLWSAYQRLIVGEADRIEALLPEAIEFVLRPYIGEAEAAKWAKRSQGQESVAASSTTP
ncbi:MAG TPA: TetR/AcrR family transcriptional regulator [Solirubrobacterales bacterium]|jgi:AcrR family transcriptional regulator|nr:TetR/AcrR family transcriptional regulator [Solirubrobacterales bacterium]